MNGLSSRPAALRARLDALYERWNRCECVAPDPLQFVLARPDPRDREVAGLVASALAYGRVAQILRSVATALAPLGARPAARLRSMRPADLDRACRGFRHRWTGPAELAALLAATGEVLRREGTLESVFAAGVAEPGSGPAAARGVDRLSRTLRDAGGPVLAGSGLLPRPGDGSACKRWNLYLRWMVRSDAVDPGGWSAIGPADLLVPLDVHLFRVARRLGLTRRRQADWKAVLEVTAGFARIRPDDPVRYDFALTRAGIHGARAPTGPGKGDGGPGARGGRKPAV